MNKKLPKVFANTLSNKISNNKKVYYGNETKDIINNEPVRKYKESIETKINKIFKSSKYVYKISVEITTNDGINEYKIVGKNLNNLITIDNKLIPISTIVDIKEI